MKSSLLKPRLPSRSTLKVSHREEPPGLTVLLEGHLDALTAPELERALDLLIEGGHPHLVVDLGNVTFIASAGLRVFLAFAKKAQRVRRHLALSRLPGHVHRVFDLAGMTAIFLIHATAEEAHATLRKRSSSR
jgi:anti-sigma B factor antagonist